MKKSLIGPLIAALLLTAGPVLAQEAAPAMQTVSPQAGSDEKMLRDILAYGVGAYDIPAARRSDLAHCSGTDIPAVVHAIGTCWPVLQTYRIFSTLQLRVKKFDALPPPQQRLVTPERSALLEAADDIIANAGPRTYPAQDAPLMFACLAKATMASDLDDWEGFRTHLTAVRGILTSSPLDAAIFEPFTLERVDQWLADAEKRRTGHPPPRKD